MLSSCILIAMEDSKLRLSILFLTSFLFRQKECAFLFEDIPKVLTRERAQKKGMTKPAVVVFLIIAFFSAMAAATDGGDISEPYDSSVFKCCKDKGWSFVIVRSYHSYGAPDSNAKPTLDHAKAAGIATRDVYHFPCKGKSASEQLNDDVSAVGKANFDTLWFDIETNPSSGCGWSGELKENCKFLKEMIDEGKSLGVKMGVYASTYMWSSIMGDECKAGSDAGLPLWYAHYDGSKGFSDFTPFGGWSKPTMKQYNDNVGICSISADGDWMP
jgi:GH25 family lysozyme M1 (1,4-beta-N-acetylmuramidase)